MQAEFEQLSLHHHDAAVAHPIADVKFHNQKVIQQDAGTLVFVTVMAMSVILHLLQVHAAHGAGAGMVVGFVAFTVHGAEVGGMCHFLLSVWFGAFLFAVVAALACGECKHGQGEEGQNSEVSECDFHEIWFVW